MQADVTAVDLGNEDLLLLCSDGLTGMLTDEQIAYTLGVANVDTHDGLATLAGELVAAANRAGGTDNVTVVLVRR